MSNKFDLLQILLHSSWNPFSSVLGIHHSNKKFPFVWQWCTLHICSETATLTLTGCIVTWRISIVIVLENSTNLLCTMKYTFGEGISEKTLKRRDSRETHSLVAQFIFAGKFCTSHIAHRTVDGGSANEHDEYIQHYKNIRTSSPLYATVIRFPHDKNLLHDNLDSLTSSLFTVFAVLFFSSCLLILLIKHVTPCFSFKRVCTFFSFCNHQNR